MWALSFFIFSFCLWSVSHAEIEHFNRDCSVNQNSPIAVNTGTPIGIRKRNDDPRQGSFFHNVTFVEGHPSGYKWLAKSYFWWTHIKAKFVGVETLVSKDWFMRIEVQLDAEQEENMELVYVDTGCIVKVGGAGKAKSINFYAIAGWITMIQVDAGTFSVKEFRGNIYTAEWLTYPSTVISHGFIDDRDCTTTNWEVPHTCSYLQKWYTMRRRLTGELQKCEMISLEEKGECTGAQYCRNRDLCNEEGAVRCLPKANTFECSCKDGYGYVGGNKRTCMKLFEVTGNGDLRIYDYQEEFENFDGASIGLHQSVNAFSSPDGSNGCEIKDATPLEGNYLKGNNCCVRFSRRKHVKGAGFGLKNIGRSTSFSVWTHEGARLNADIDLLKREVPSIAGGATSARVDVHAPQFIEKLCFADASVDDLKLGYL